MAFINSFVANGSHFIPPENNQKRFSDVFWGYKMGILSRNGLRFLHFQISFYTVLHCFISFVKLNFPSKNLAFNSLYNLKGDAAFIFPPKMKYSGLISKWYVGDFFERLVRNVKWLLTHLTQMFHFHTSWKGFDGAIELEHWRKMGLKRFFVICILLPNGQLCATVEGEASLTPC